MGRYLKITVKNKCSMPECYKVEWSRGLCKNHYGVARGNGYIEIHAVKNPLRGVRVPQGARTYKQGADCVFPGCDSPGVTRGKCIYHYQLSYRTGMDDDSLAALLALGACESCGSTKKLSIDHDHACCDLTSGQGRRCGNCNRGLLCHNCNTALGFLDDSTERVYQLLKYMERF